MENTTGAFWGMVMQERVARIVTLVQHMGDDGDCASYFPTSQVGQEEIHGNIKLTLLSEETSMPMTVRRDFKLEHVNTGETSQVSHYHFQGWEDW